MKHRFALPFHALTVVICLAACLNMDLTNAMAATSDLTELSLEDLMLIEVTATLSRKEKKVSDTAAAVFVITDEDIRHSGVTTIPDALRMVPGLEVARIDANQWAVTARGFNGVFANKLLVLMDGRSVYTPLYSGVCWDVQDTMMEDIARIEVIRGPGASLWGANAVNGVINIVTKPADETQGGLVAAGTGSEEKLFGGIRYGGTLGDAAYYRAYAKWFDRDSGHSPTDYEVEDQWRGGRAGGRLDWALTNKDAITFQGDYYEEDTGASGSYAILEEPYRREVDEELPISGGNMVGRWQHNFSATSELIVQTYFDHTQRKFPFLEEVRDTFDLDLQHRFRWTDRQEVIWGVGYRLTHATIDDSPLLTIRDERDYLPSFFIQDEIYFIPQILSMQIGSKFEKNSYTDWEVQPNLRLLWQPHVQHTFWSSISRAVRTPSQAEPDVRLVEAVYPGPPKTYIVVEGNDDFQSEELIAYESGYRYRPLDTLSMDLALFYNAYDNLRTIEPGTPHLEGDPAHRVVPYYAANKMHGFTYGAELAVEYRPLAWWRLYAAYTYLEMELQTDADSHDRTMSAAEDENPHHQLSIRSMMNVGPHWQVDLWGRFVDELPGQNLPGYMTMDARLGWRPSATVEISLVGQNLLDDAHLEYSPEIVDFYPSEVQRSVYVKVVWQL